MMPSCWSVLEWASRFLKLLTCVLVCPIASPLWATCPRNRTRVSAAVPVLPPRLPAYSRPRLPTEHAHDDNYVRRVETDWADVSRLEQPGIIWYDSPIPSCDDVLPVNLHSEWWQRCRIVRSV